MPVRPKRRRRADHPLLWQNLFIRDVLNLRLAIWGVPRDCPQDEIRCYETLQQAWELNRDMLMSPQTRENENGYEPGTRPVCWWMFEAPEPPREDETQEECLHRLGILTDDERQQLDRARELESWIEHGCPPRQKWEETKRLKGDD